MRIRLNSIFVDDQDKALKFYTEVLGFVKSVEIPMGEYRWLTVRRRRRRAVAGAECESGSENLSAGTVCPGHPGDGLRGR